MIQLGKYGEETTFYFPLVTKDAPDFLTEATSATGDIVIIKDGGTPDDTTNGFVEEGNGWYSLTLTATEMQAARICISIVDQSDPKVWEDQAILIQTHGNASASLPYDLSDTEQDVNITSIDGSATAAEQLAIGAALGIVGAAETGTLTSTSMTTNLSGYADDLIIKRTLYFTSGDLSGMGLRITSYTESSGLVEFEATYTGGSPSNGDTFIII